MKNILVFLLIASTIIQGGFYPNLYLIIGLFLSILLFFHKTITVHLPTFLIYLTVFILYASSAVLHNFSLIEYSPVFQVLIYPIFFLLLSNIKPEEQKYLFAGIVLCGIIVAFIGILSYVDVLKLPGMISRNRLQGLLQYANASAILLSVSLITLKYFTKQLQWSKPVMTVALQLTLSFGGILCYWISIFIYTLLQPKGKKLQSFITEILEFSIYGIITALIYISVNIFNIKVLSIFIALLACILGFIIIKFNIKIPFCKITSVFSLFLGFIGIASILMLRGKEALGTLLERIVHSIDGIKAVLSNPILGLGPGRWASEKVNWQSANYRAQIIHNSYVQIAVDAGILALILVLIIIVFWFKKTKKEVWNISAVCCLLLHGLLDMSFYFTSISLISITLINANKKKEGCYFILHKKLIWFIALISTGLFLYFNIIYQTT